MSSTRKPDKTLAGVANFLSDPKRPIETTLRAMMTTPHLGEAGPHPVVASAARELLNKSENERSGVLSTAMSFLGLYRDPVVAQVTRRCDWRIDDLVVGRAAGDALPRRAALRHQPHQAAGPPGAQPDRPPADRGAGCKERGAIALLLMLDEFPALGRLDFFESALAFMAGYGLKSFLIAQSLNQIEKAYGPNNAILDNCHVRVSFATNDERTAKRVSDALGTATEIRDARNYAGHRLSPWLGHLMVSRQETARPLLTPGEVMQLPPSDELVLVSGLAPIRAKKARYFEDRRLTGTHPAAARYRSGRTERIEGRSITADLKDDWSSLALPNKATADPGQFVTKRLDDKDSANGGIRREPEIPEHEAIAPETPPSAQSLDDAPPEEPDDEEAIRARALRSRIRIGRAPSFDGSRRRNSPVSRPCR